MGGPPQWRHDDIADRSAERPPPAADAPELDWLLYEQDQVLTRAQALRLMTIDRLRHLIEHGRWQRIRSGIFVAHNGPLARNQQLWVAVLGCGFGAVLAGLTAACEGGLRRDAGRHIHVLVPAASRPNQPGRSVLPARHPMPMVIAHRTTDLPSRDLASAARPPRTDIARSVVDAAQWAGTDDEARAIVAAACQQRRTSAEEIREVVDRMRRAHRRAIVMETIGFTTRGAEALSEINLVKLCRRNRLPVPDLQVRRRDRNGRLRYLDARWRAFGVCAEVDGGIHTDPEVWWEDMRRQNDLWVAGERLLRFPAWAIIRREAEVADQLRAAFAAGGASG
ncbi:MAG: hypothetical protein ACM30G_02370 [Micromonosporaceae bacterium]